MRIEYIVAHYTCRHHTFCASAGTTRGIINHPAAFHHMICRSHCIRHAILMILAMSNALNLVHTHQSEIREVHGFWLRIFEPMPTEQLEQPMVQYTIRTVAI